VKLLKSFGLGKPAGQATLLLAVIAVFCTFSTLLHKHRTVRPLKFVPSVIDLGELMEEGPPATIDAELTNSSSAPIQVVEFARSCSCITVKSDAAPFTLGPGDSRQVSVAINPRGRVGLNHFGLDAHSAEGRFTGEIRMKAHIAKSLTPFPGSHVIRICEEDEGALRPAHHTFLLADGLAGDPLEPRLSCSDPSRMRCSLRRVTGDVPWGGGLLKKRFELDVEYAPPRQAKSCRESVTIAPIAGARPFKVDISGEWSPAAVLEPIELMIVGQTAAAVHTRIVEYRFRGHAYAAQRWEVDGPARITVRKIEESESRMLFKLSCKIPDEAPCRTKTLLRFYSAKKIVTLPITMIVDPAPVTCDVEALSGQGRRKGDAARFQEAIP